MKHRYYSRRSRKERSFSDMKIPVIKAGQNQQGVNRRRIIYG